MEEIRILGESDWDDQDLLTLDEAQFRIREEIEAIEANLQTEESSVDEAARLRMARRLKLLRALDESYTEALAANQG